MATSPRNDHSAGVRYAPDPRDVAPPGAPKKAKLKPTPTDANPPPFFLHGPAPHAPIKGCRRTVKLSKLPQPLRKLAASHAAAVYLSAFRKAFDGDSDWAHDDAEREAIICTPLALADESLRDFITANVSSMTFEWATDELWFEREHSLGKLARIVVCAQPLGQFSKTRWEFPIEELEGSPSLKRTASDNVKAENGHFEFQKIGKGGREWFWVEARAIN